MRLKHCHNFHDFRELARRRLPGPIFNYIDGAADDETTYRRNTRAFEACDLAIGMHSGRGVDFAARADVLAPDLKAIGDLLEAAAQREETAFWALA